MHEYISSSLFLLRVRRLLLITAEVDILTSFVNYLSHRARSILLPLSDLDVRITTMHLDLLNLAPLFLLHPDLLLVREISRESVQRTSQVELQAKVAQRYHEGQLVQLSQFVRVMLVIVFLALSLTHRVKSPSLVALSPLLGAHEQS